MFVRPESTLTTLWPYNEIRRRVQRCFIFPLFRAVFRESLDKGVPILEALWLTASSNTGRKM